LPNALSKETLGQTLANPLRVHPWTSIVISFSSREIPLLSSHSNILIKGPRVS